MICPYCKKEFETNLSLGCHKVRCSLNPNKKNGTHGELHHVGIKA